MQRIRHTMVWLVSIGCTLLIVMFSSAWLAHQQRLQTFEAELQQLHRTNSLHLQQLQFQLQQDALLAAELVHANSLIRQTVIEAAQLYSQSNDASELDLMRAAIDVEVEQQWQVLQPFAARQLHLHLGPDAFTLLRAHRPERHSDRLADVRPIVMSVLEGGEALVGLEVGRHGMGVRAVVPVLSSEQKTIGAIEVGLGVQPLIYLRQQVLLREGIMDTGLSVLLSQAVGSILHPAEQVEGTADSHWLLAEDADFIKPWLQQGLLPAEISKSQFFQVQHEQQHFLVSLLPWHSYQQPKTESADVVLVVWQDITALLASQQRQNLRLWGLWLLAAFVSLALIVFFALRLKQATTLQLKAQQQQLRWSEQRLSALFTLSPLPILLNRLSDGAFIELNPAMEQLVGYQQAEIKTLSYWDLTPAIYATDEQAQLDSMRINGRYGPYRKQYRHKDGHLIDIELNGVLFENPAGEQMIWTIVQDLTEQKKLDRMKDEFISTVSHELRTPLTSIAGSLSLVLSGVAGELSEKTGKMLEVASRNCQRLNSLVNDLLDVEKLVAGKVDFAPQKLSVLTLLQDAVEQNLPYAQNHQIRLEIAAIEAHTVWADPARVQQVMANLLSNAIKFSPAGSLVRISAVESPAMVRIVVHDQGPGLNADEISRLFQRFAQLDNSSTKQQGGTGLGLAICREIIEQSGGQIGVESDAGQGSRFWFELPKTF